MKYLILILSVLSSFAVAKHVPSHMLMNSMADINKKSDVIVDVVVESSQGDYVLDYIGADGAFTETYMLHEVTITKIYKGHNGAGYGHNKPVKMNDRIYVRQWGSDENHYDGVPVLTPGNSYRLYLNPTYFTEPTTSARIFSITGVNGGLFSLNKKGKASRGANNKSSIAPTD